MHDVIEEVRRLALDRGIVVTGSEVVGMVPYPALLETGKYYLKRQGRPTGIPDKDILETAVQSLGLRDVGSFVIEEQVIGLPKLAENALVSMKVSDFIAEVSRETPAPGGGSVAALAGALGAGLVSMVSALTAYKTGNAEIDDKLNTAAEQCQAVIQALVKTIDDDTAAFNAYREALRLPDKTEEQTQAKKTAVQNAITNAALIPLQTAELSLKALKAAEIAAEYGNVNAISDVGVSVHCAFAGVMGGIYNVMINIKDIKDNIIKSDFQRRCAEVSEEARTLVQKVTGDIEKKIGWK
jgi:glutamate formiminotransferase/formiminotetrahydrofolate cyclodeaminase